MVPELAKVGIELHKVSKDEFATCDLWSTNGETLADTGVHNTDRRSGCKVA